MSGSSFLWNYLYDFEYLGATYCYQENVYKYDLKLGSFLSPKSLSENNHLKPRPWKTKQQLDFMSSFKEKL